MCVSACVGVLRCALKAVWLNLCMCVCVWSRSLHSLAASSCSLYLVAGPLSSGLVVRRVARPAAGTLFSVSCYWQPGTRRRLVITLNWNCFVCAQLVSCYSLSAVIAADTRVRFVQWLDTLRSTVVTASSDKNFTLTPLNYLYFIDSCVRIAES